MNQSRYGLMAVLLCAALLVLQGCGGGDDNGSNISQDMYDALQADYDAAVGARDTAMTAQMAAMDAQMTAVMERDAAMAGQMAAMEAQVAAEGRATEAGMPRRPLPRPLP